MSRLIEPESRHATPSPSPIGLAAILRARLAERTVCAAELPHGGRTWAEAVVESLIAAAVSADADRVDAIRTILERVDGPIGGEARELVRGEVLLPYAMAHSLEPYYAAAEPMRASCPAATTHASVRIDERDHVVDPHD